MWIPRMRVVDKRPLPDRCHLCSAPTLLATIRPRQAAHRPQMLSPETASRAIREDADRRQRTDQRVSRSTKDGTLVDLPAGPKTEHRWVSTRRERFDC
jgi:hypothetical protein